MSEGISRFERLFFTLAIVGLSFIGLCVPYWVFCDGGHVLGIAAGLFILALGSMGAVLIWRA